MKTEDMRLRLYKNVTLRAYRRMRADDYPLATAARENLESFTVTVANIRSVASCHLVRKWQRHLSFRHKKIGETQSQQGDRAGALKSYQANKAIAQKLAASDPSNSRWQADVAVSAWNIGTMKGSPQTNAERRAVLAQGLKSPSGTEAVADTAWTASREFSGRSTSYSRHSFQRRSWGLMTA